MNNISVVLIMLLLFLGFMLFNNNNIEKTRNINVSSIKTPYYPYWDDTYWRPYDRLWYRNTPHPMWRNRRHHRRFY